MTTDFVVPRTLQEFYVALGKRILVNAKDADAVRVARAWCAIYAPLVETCAFLAERAAQESCPHTSLASDRFTNLQSVETMLAVSRPPYFADMFNAGTNQEGDGLMAFFDLLQQIDRATKRDLA